MKKNKNKSERWLNGCLALFLVAVLVLGTGGLVYGETEESGVTTTVTEDTIEVDDVTYTDGSGTDQELVSDNDPGDDTEYSESNPDDTDTGVDFSVQVTVYSDEDLNNIDFARIDIRSENQDMGDALGESENTDHFYHEWDNTGDGWDGESETLNVDLTTDDTDSFLRYGDWEIYAEIVDSEEAVLDSETFDTDILFVEEYTEFLGPADLTATIDPGESVGINTGDPDVTFTEDSGGTGEAHLDVVTNYAWTLGISDTELTSEDSPDSIPTETEGYSNEGGSPTTEINPDVELLYTDTNVRPGTYETTLTHTLSNDDSG